MPMPKNSVENAAENATETLRARFPQNKVIVDAHGQPSVMVYVPAFCMCDVIDGGSDMPHPAFVRNGEVLHGIYISKFQNTWTDGHACAIPDKDPVTCIDYDAAVRACSEKGEGWHLMSAAEWGAVALWCRKNGWLPWGNNDWGKDYRENISCARLSYEDREASICRTETGSGPFEWSHDHFADGIWDLNGNVWEWVGGLRLVYGEVQFCEDHSEAWFALDGQTGERIVPNGNGTTPNSIKLDYINGIWTYISTQVTDSLAKPRFCEFNHVKADETLCFVAREQLIAWGLLPSHPGEDLSGVSLYANNGAAERLPFRGGRWGQGKNAGVFKTCLDDPRTYAGHAVGFRCAYCEV
jgi:hypothetical protein